MEAKYREITLLEPVCEKLKIIYYKNIDWSKCYKHVADKLSILKSKARDFYTDKNELEIAMELSKFSQPDIQDMMSLTKLI